MFGAVYFGASYFAQGPFEAFGKLTLPALTAVVEILRFASGDVEVTRHVNAELAITRSVEGDVDLLRELGGVEVRVVRFVSTDEEMSS